MKLRAAELGGEIEFVPDILVRTGENGLTMSTIATKFAGEPHDAFNVLRGRSLFLLCPRDCGGFSRQVFNQNGVFLVGFVTGCGRLDSRN